MKKRLFSVDAILAILSITSLVLAGVVVWLMPEWVLYILAGLAVVTLLVWFNINNLRKIIAKIMNSAGTDGSAGQSVMVKLQLPIVVATGKSVVWYNESFLKEILKGQDASLLPVHKVIPNINLYECVKQEGQSLTIEDEKYTCFGAYVGDAGSEMLVIYFVNDTALKDTAEEYAASRPCVMRIIIDTYDETLKEMKDSDRAKLMAEINIQLENYVGQSTGFLTHTSVSQYIAVVEERHMQEMIKDTFSILDKVRKLGENSTTATLSIGVARGFSTFVEADSMAQQAIDMALGRGGDQVAIRTSEGYEFFGGVSRSVEKKTKVKSRIIASALKDLIMQSDSVLIMGHRMGDLDSLGASMGLMRICKICGVPAAIVIREDKTLAEPLIKRIKENNLEEDLASPEEVQGHITQDTLLIITDTHIAHMLEAPAIYKACKRVVVIDHHRKMVDHIDNALLLYLEPYASSASELVAEMLPYVAGKDEKPTALEAAALLAGIMLDTRNFAVRTGVRTFEAAAYLRRMGAQTASVQKMFATPQEVYTAKAELVSMAQIYKNCAVAVAEEQAETDYSVVAPQAANDLLTIEGIQASFVALPSGGQVNISARSLGEVNVQVIMEELGGGGHLTMAGAQLKDVSIEEAKQKIFNEIDKYYEKHK